MSVTNDSKSRVFLVALGRHCKPLSEALKDANATMFNLNHWVMNESFIRKLKRVMRRRRQIHDLSTTLTRMWAADQFAERLQESVKPESPTATDAEKAARDRLAKHEAAALDLLRKASQASSNKVVDEPEPTQRSFVHPGVPAAEQATLIEMLSQGDNEPSSAKAA